MFCSHCGSMTKGTEKFCTRCGNPVFCINDIEFQKEKKNLISNKFKKIWSDKVLLITIILIVLALIWDVALIYNTIQYDEEQKLLLEYLTEVEVANNVIPPMSMVPIALKILFDLIVTGWSMRLLLSRRKKKNLFLLKGLKNLLIMYWAVIACTMFVVWYSMGGNEYIENTDYQKETSIDDSMSEIQATNNYDENVEDDMQKESDEEKDGILNELKEALDISSLPKVELLEGKCKIYDEKGVIDVPMTEEEFLEKSCSSYNMIQEQTLLSDESRWVVIMKELDLSDLECTHSGGYERYESLSGVRPSVEVMIYHDNKAIHASYQNYYVVASAGYDYDTYKIQYFTEDLSEFDENGRKNENHSCEKVIDYNNVTGEVDRYTIKSRRNYSEEQDLSYGFSRENTYMPDGGEPVESIYMLMGSNDIRVIYDATGELYALVTYCKQIESAVAFIISEGRWYWGMASINEMVEVISQGGQINSTFFSSHIVKEEDNQTKEIDYGDYISGVIEKRHRSSDPILGGYDYDYYVLDCDKQYTLEVTVDEGEPFIDCFSEILVNFEGGIEQYEGQHIICRVDNAWENLIHGPTTGERGRHVIVTISNVRIIE